MSEHDYKVVDAVVGLMTPEAMKHRPGWGEDFFEGKMNAAKGTMGGFDSLEAMIEVLDDAGIEKAFLFAQAAGRPGLPGCFHMPYEVVAEACERYPGRLYGMAGIDPYDGMDGVRRLEDAVKNMGFIGAHLYPHWFDMEPEHRKLYPFYAKCVELCVPIQMQVGQSMVYNKNFPCKSTGRPISFDTIACDFQELKLIGIHVGIPWHDEMIAMAWKHENVFIGTDAHRPKYWPESFKKYINSFGQNKVIYGSDYPVLPFKRTIEDFDALGFKPEVRRKVLHDNALRIYGIDP